MVGRYLPASVTAVPADDPPFDQRGWLTRSRILESWQPGPPQPWFGWKISADLLAVFARALDANITVTLSVSASLDVLSAVSGTADAQLAVSGTPDATPSISGTPDAQPSVSGTLDVMPT